MGEGVIPLLEQRVQANPHDSEAWQMLVDELWAVRHNQGMMEKLLKTLRDVVAKYPSAAKCWKILIDHELDNKQIDNAVAMFSECLLKCHSMPLWLSYMRFIKMTNASKGDAGHVEVMKAYDYVLDRLGQDSAAGALWSEYINFMSNFAVNSNAFKLLFEPEVGKEASKRALRLRDLYQKALIVPGEHLEMLWPEYERFEATSAGRNNLAGQRFTEEARPRFQAAKEAWARRGQLLAALERDVLPELPGLSPPSATFGAQKAAWRAYLDFEKENVQNLDKSLHRKRVDLAYQQALQPLAGCPDMWCEWATLWRECGDEYSTAHECTVLQAASAALPNCVMLSFALADALHAAKKTQDASQIYENLVSKLEKSSGPNEIPPESGNSVWIQYMRFQGRIASSVQEAQAKCRQIFMKARKWQHCSWQVFAYHALMEWKHHGTVHIVKSIFELGLKNPMVQCVPEYIREYAKWLSRSPSEVNNARLVFKNAVANEVVHKTSEIWDYFLEFEAEHGTVQEMLAVELQRRNALGEKTTTALDNLLTLRTRYETMGLWPCTKEQRRYIETLQGVVERRPEPNGSTAAEAAAPAHLSLFLEKLPDKLEDDQPGPDVDFLIDIVMSSTHPALGLANGSRGVKRTAHGMGEGSSYADIFTARQKLKVSG